MKIYLAGPISYIAFDQAVGWREDAGTKLVGHTVLSPMRGKSYLSQKECIGDSYDTPLSCSRGIMTRDHWDVERCDVLIANLLHAVRVSIGTVMEIAWAHAYRKPVILVMRQDSIHDHAMIREATGFWVKTMDEAIEIALHLGK